MRTPWPPYCRSSRMPGAATYNSRAACEDMANNTRARTLRSFMRPSMPWRGYSGKFVSGADSAQEKSRKHSGIGLLFGGDHCPVVGDGPERAGQTHGGKAQG